MPPQDGSYRYHLRRSEQLRRIEEESAEYLESLSPPNPDWPVNVRLVASRIHERLLDSKLSVTGVKDHIHLNSHDFTSWFASFVGEGMKRYIATHRLQLAKRLLRYDKIKIFEIAHAVGYRSHSAFSKAFLRIEGCTPTEFRKISGEKEGDLSSEDEG